MLDKRKEEFCPVCTYPIDECVCCTECGHDCPLEQGESYCPVCSPYRGEKDSITPP